MMRINQPNLTDLPTFIHSKIGWPWTEVSPQLPQTMPDGSSWPRVSIVTPSYNQGQFIEETIRSVLLQGYPNLEYIIIDGGSTDGSVDIIRKYEPWLTYWVSEKDEGQSDAINKGWGRATGEILAWLNSDDLYAPGAVGAAAETLNKYSEVAFVYSNCQYIDAQGEPIILRRPGPFDFKRLLWALASHIPQPTTFIRKSVLDIVGLLDTALDYSMDYDLWLRIGMCYPFCYMDEVWASTRIHDEAKTVTAQSKIWEQKIKVLDKVKSSPYLPVKIQLEMPDLYSKYYLQMTRVCLRNLDYIGSLCYFRQAVAMRPVLLFEWQSWRKLLKTVWKSLLFDRVDRYWPRAESVKDPRSLGLK